MSELLNHSLLFLLFGQRENIRRKHNYLPLIMEVLKLLAKRGELVPLVKQVSSQCNNWFLVTAILLKDRSLSMAGKEKSRAEGTRKAKEEEGERRRNYKSVILYACLAKQSCYCYNNYPHSLHNYTPMSLIGV